jgi:hypothetical protein
LVGRSTLEMCRSVKPKLDARRAAPPPKVSATQICVGDLPSRRGGSRQLPSRRGGSGRFPSGSGHLASRRGGSGHLPSRRGGSYPLSRARRASRARRMWLAGMRLRARIADYYHAETFTFKYHLRNWLCKCGLRSCSTPPPQGRRVCAGALWRVMCKLLLLNAGAHWFTSPSAGTMADAVSTSHVEWAYENRADPLCLEA